MLACFFFNLKSKIKNRKLTKQAVNVLVGDLGEGGSVFHRVCRFANGFLEDRGDLESRAFRADLNESNRRTFVEYDDQKASTDYADKNTFAPPS
jgi:hypothetical protein